MKKKLTKRRKTIKRSSEFKVVGYSEGGEENKFGDSQTTFSVENVQKESIEEAFKTNGAKTNVK